MPTVDEVVTKLQNIITKSNNATGASDTTVNAAVDRLIDGYGSGGGDGGELARSIVERTITEYADDEITSVGAYAFRGCSYLRNVDLPKAITLSAECFRDSALVSVIFPKVTNISNATFYGCSSLEKVELPLCNKQVASQAFFGCTSLKKLSCNFSAISNNAFRNSAIEALIMNNNSRATLANTNAFDKTPIASGTGYIYVPSALVEDYKAATNWSTYADQIRAIEDYPEITDPEETT